MSVSLRITFLGTGTSSGVPMIGCHCDVCSSTDQKDKRLRSSVLIESPETKLVIDTTPDFRTQMLRISNDTLNAVLFTHPHKDHIGGLDDIRPYNYFMQQPMNVYANAMTTESLMREFAYAFADKKYPGIPEINLITIDETPFQIGDIPVTPIQVWHHKMPVFGYRLGDFTYITDANRIDDSEKEKIKGSKIMVVNALRREEHISHFTVDEATALVNELKVPQAYFTHISHQLGKHNEVNATLPGHIRLAYDGLAIDC
ncbi:MBL fold metallo-hydrolase [Filimonas effusa]|uniref:MBL fold metallo-hydrolase n=1 Tax=Filimonas effusa TaxID=2508721 RepID=A0A4Q1D5U3_9BACT|nr:MBL fold metallo-hydrolase [Filimonas effusa]RXK83346.1 MBL fold metallo-hydrolase [Filimonas effusa]